MKQIFLSVQEKLGEVAALKYIDKDWGQLKYEQPPVKFPCALLDVENVPFSQLGQLHQLAEAQLTILLADYRLTPSSQRSPRRKESYAIFDLINEIHQVLHGYSNGQIQPLVRTNISKVESNAGYEIYKLTYNTAWKEVKNRELVPVNAKVKLKVENA